MPAKPNESAVLKIPLLLISLNTVPPMVLLQSGAVDPCPLTKVDKIISWKKRAIVIGTEHFLKSPNVAENQCLRGIKKDMMDKRNTTFFIIVTEVISRKSMKI